MKIPVSHGHLEAVLREPQGQPRGAAVVCHPHPLHGGTMHTKAVYRTAQGLVDAGWAALRFNFRGVGASTGSYDDGIGERDDVRAALDWLEARYPHLPLAAGGFSFGSLVALAVGAADPRVVALVGVGLPLGLDARYDFTFLAETLKPVLLVQGEEDEFGPGPVIASATEGFGPHVTLVRVPETDHFFTDAVEALRVAVREYFTLGPGAGPFSAP